MTTGEAKAVNPEPQTLDRDYKLQAVINRKPTTSRCFYEPEPYTLNPETLFAGDKMTTGEAKALLIDTLHPIIARHQRARAAVRPKP